MKWKTEKAYYISTKTQTVINIPRGSVLLGKYLFGEMSVGNMSVRGLSIRQVSSERCLLGQYPSENCLDNILNMLEYHRTSFKASGYTFYYSLSKDIKKHVIVWTWPKNNHQEGKILKSSCVKYINIALLI